MKISIRSCAVALFSLIALNSFAQRVGGFNEINLDDNAGTITYLTAQQGSLGINGMDVLPDPCALLDLNSTTKGLLIPRMTGAQVSALCAVPGMLAYNTTTNNFEYYNGGSWATIVSTGAWGIGGNDNITTEGVDNLLGTMNTSTYYPFNVVVGGNRIVRYETQNRIIGGDVGNTISGASNYAVIAGGGAPGFTNSITAGDYGTIGGGGSNVVSAQSGTVSGGGFNSASALRATVAGGAGNTASGQGAFVGGGEFGSALGANNTASGANSVVVGGLLNTANGFEAVIVGGRTNTASAQDAFVGAGEDNDALGNWSFVGGGESNQATLDVSTVVGGSNNSASNFGAFVGGGGYDGVALAGNTASGQGSAIVGGLGHTASGVGSFIGGGGIGGIGGGLIAGNQATGLIATVAGGYNNISSNNIAFIGGGANNTASGISSTVAGGAVNSAIGYRSAIAGGARLSVGDNSFGFNGENTPGLVTDPPSLITDITGFPFTAYFGNVDLWIGNTTSNAKALRFYENNASLTYAGTNYAAIKSPAVLAADYTLTLPVDDGNDGQALITDGTGTLAWGNNLKSTTGGAALQIGTAATANGFTVHASNLVTNNAGANPAPANGHSVYTFTGIAYAGAATLPGVATTGKIVSVINGTGGAIMVAVAGGNYTINLNRAAQFISNGTNWYPLSN